MVGIVILILSESSRLGWDPVNTIQGIVQTESLQRMHFLAVWERQVHSKHAHII